MTGGFTDSGLRAARPSAAAPSSAPAPTSPAPAASPSRLPASSGVSFVAAPAGTGSQIGVAAQRSRAFAKVTVRLASGGTAHAWLQVAVADNYPASACQPVTAHWLRVYPPGETVAGYVSHTSNACSSPTTALLTVLPVRAGLALAGITP